MTTMKDKVDAAAEGAREQLQQHLVWLERKAEDATRRQKAEAAVWHKLMDIADDLPMIPSKVHTYSAYAGTPACVVFVLSALADVRDWREKTAAIMQAFPPCPLFRFKDSCLSFTPELNEKQRASAVEGRAEVEEIVPFTLRLTQVTGYAPKVEVTWFTCRLGERLWISVELDAELQTGARPAGFDYAKRYEYAGGRDRFAGWTASWPFRPGKVSRFWADGTHARPEVAWWPLNVVADDVPAHDAFFNLTTPKEG